MEGDPARRRSALGDPSARSHPAPLGEWQWHLPAVVAGCVGLAVLAGTYAYPHERGHKFLIVLLACIPILLLRRWPAPVLAAAVVATGFVVASGDAPIGLSAMVAVATYSAATCLPRRASVRAVLLAGAALGVALLYSALAWHSPPLGVQAAESFLPLASGWFVGDAVAARRSYVAGLVAQDERERVAEADRARREVREERVRIARELHDVVAHSLAVITVQAGVGRRLMARRPEAAAEALALIESIGRTAQDELRVVLGLLRDEDGSSLALAPTPRLADVTTVVETVRASGVPVDLELSGTDRRLSPALELSIVRVVQEALTNVVKHAPGARARVDVAVSDDDVQIAVIDDGGTSTRHPLAATHHPPSCEPAGAGQGILGMRERVGAFGGWLTAGPVPGRGFRVLARVPVEDPA